MPRLDEGDSKKKIQKKRLDKGYCCPKERLARSEFRNERINVETPQLTWRTISCPLGGRVMLSDLGCPLNQMSRTSGDLILYKP